MSSNNSEMWHVVFTKSATKDNPRTTQTGWACEGNYESAVCSAMHAIMAAIAGEFDDFASLAASSDYRKTQAVQLLHTIRIGSFPAALHVADRAFGWTFSFTVNSQPPVGYPVKQMVIAKAIGLLTLGGAR
jgi:hypothetical protein